MAGIRSLVRDARVRWPGGKPPNVVFFDGGVQFFQLVGLGPLASPPAPLDQFPPALGEAGELERNEAEHNSRLLPDP
jgi:hypothetical protein